MKKLINHSNPFVLMLIPVMFALLMGIAYQFSPKQEFTEGNNIQQAKQATSLFVKGVTLFKTVCGISQENVW